MNLEKLKSGSYRVTKMVDGHRYRVTFDHKPTRKEIDVSLSALISEGSPIKSGTFEDYANDFLKITDSTLKPSTRRGYLVALRGMPESFKRKQLKAITNSDIQAMINRRAKEVSPKTCMNIKGFVGSVMSMYRPDFRVNVKCPARPRYDKYVPTPEEVQQVLDYVNGTQFYIVFRLSLYGLRRGETAALTINDLSEDDVITVNKAYSEDAEYHWHLMDTPKTAASNRTVKIDHELAELIREQGYIYHGSIDYLNDKLTRVQNHLGQTHHWRFHDFRGYMVSELSAAGIDESTILAVGGWSSPNIMKSLYRRSRYESKPEVQESVIDVLKEFTHDLPTDI